MADADGSATGSAQRRSLWASVLPTVFVIVTLLAILVVPGLVQRQINALWREINEVAEPARLLLVDANRALAREMAAVRAYALTEDPRFLDVYRVVLEQERIALEDLRPLALHLDEEATAAYRAFEVAAEAWHARPTETEILAGVLDPAEYVLRIPAEQAIWDRLLDAADVLGEALARAGAELRADLIALERRLFFANVLLVAMGILAGFVAAWLGWRNRRLLLASERAHRELQQVVANRARLIRGITHDLKNPLGAVQGYAELLHSGTLGAMDDRQRKAVSGAWNAAGSALDLIQDLLDLSLAEAGELRVESKPVDVAAEVRRALDDFDEPARKAGLELSVELDDDLPPARADAHRVRQIVGNLLSNAIKYTPEGGRVRVSARAERDRDAAPADRRLAIRVADTGPGVPEDKQELIFQEFSRLEPGTERGAGLGLAISRRIARALGGDVSVSSSPGAGSTFTLWLPVDHESRRP